MKSKESQPLVSVIIPVYNRGHLLPRTIKSVLSQTYKNLEILVVDDGSSEDIKGIAEGFNDQRIRCLRHDKNRGICAARNTGIKAARGEFISFLDSDDEYLPERTEKLLEVFENCETDVAYCGMYKRFMDGTQDYMVTMFKERKWFFLLQQIMAKREAIEKTGVFDTDFICVEDTDYLYRMSKKCRFAGIGEPLVVYNDVPGSHSKNIELINEYEVRFYEKHADTVSPLEKSRWFYKIAKLHLRDKKIIPAYKIYYRAFIAYPLNESALRKLIRLFPLFLFHVFKRHKGKNIDLLREELGTGG